MKMNRRNFFSSLGGAVAAAMLPFGVKIKLAAPKKAKAALTGFWYQETVRVRCFSPEYLSYLKAIAHASRYGEKES